MNQDPVATLIIVAYGRSDLVEALLDSISKHTPEAHEVIVVDNASPDDTAEQVRKHPSGPRLISAPHNLGYGGGVNLGVRNSSSESIVIMNSDLRVTQNWLTPLLEEINSNRAAIAAPLYIDEDRKIVESGASVTFDGHVHQCRTSFGGVKVVDHVSAACWAFKKQWFESMGGFDPTYGLGYYEDADLISAARLDKNSVVVVSKSRIIHRVGESFDSAATRFLSHRNHARNEARWRWLYREADHRAWNAEVTITHGRVAVIGDHPRLVSELRQQNISVATLGSIEELSNRNDRDDVVVIEHQLDEATEKAPRAEITTPGEISAALRRAGIAPNSRPPRPRFSSIASALSRRW